MLLSKIRFDNLYLKPITSHIRRSRIGDGSGKDPGREEFGLHFIFVFRQGAKIYDREGTKS
jgi:hypothetical protein